MASRKTLNRRPRPQRATSNVFAMFDQAQIQACSFKLVGATRLKECNSLLLTNLSRKLSDMSISQVEMLIT